MGLTRSVEKREQATKDRFWINFLIEPVVWRSDAKPVTFPPSDETRLDTCYL